MIIDGIKQCDGFLNEHTTHLVLKCKNTSDYLDRLLLIKLFTFAAKLGSKLLHLSRMRSPYALIVSINFRESTPAEFGRHLAYETQGWDKVLKFAGNKAQ